MCWFAKTCSTMCSSILLAIFPSAVAVTHAPPVTNFVDFAASELGDIKCGPEQDYESLMDAHLIHYTSDEKYDKFDGYDLVKDYAKRPRDMASSDEKPKTVRCVGEDKEEGTWHVQRIGPFRSTGGNDWWQFTWLDMFGFDGSLGNEYQILGAEESYGMTGHWTGPITSDGKPIPLPPLHIHHIHLTQGAGLSWSSDFLDCSIDGKNCPDGGMIYAHHGDKQKLDKDDPRLLGLHAFGEDYGQGWAKKLYEPISCTGEINDLRPAGSPEIEWWYQSAVRIVRGKKNKDVAPLSMHYLYNPFEIGINTQFSRFGCYRVHPSHDTVHVYTGRMPYGGELIHPDAHMHMSAAQQMYLFSGSPEDLGLGALAFDYTWVPLNTVEALRAMGLTPAASEPAGGANNQKIVDVLSRSVSEGRAYQVCHAKANRVKLDGRSWDRASSLECNPWSFESGTQYTSVAFNGNPDLPDMRDAPGIYYNAISQLTRPSSIPKEFTFTQHAHWFLTYASTDQYSKYTWALGSQDPDAITPIVSKADLYRLLVWGTPRHGPTFFDTFVLFPLLNLALALLKLFHPTFTWFSPWPLRTAFWLIVALFVAMLAAFYAFLWAIRNPTVNLAVNRLSLNTIGKRISLGADLPDKTHYPIGLEIMSYLSLAATCIAVFAAAVTIIVPGDIYLVSDFGQELIQEAGEELNWSTGKPSGRYGVNASFVLVALPMILGLGAVAFWCLRNTIRAEVARRRLSERIHAAMAFKSLRDLIGAIEEEDEEMEESIECAPMLSSKDV